MRQKNEEGLEIRMVDILLVDEDQEVIEELQRRLELNSYSVVSLNDGETAFRYIRETMPRLVLCGRDLPGMPGLSLCRNIKVHSSNVAVILISSRSSENDKINGLDAGADDYVTKPLVLGELLARIRSVLRRYSFTHSHPLVEEGVYVCNELELEVNASEHRVTRCGVHVHVPAAEFKLLVHLIKKPRKVFSRVQLLDALYGGDVEHTDRIIDTYVMRLRHTLRVQGKPDVVRTIYGGGYALM